MPRKQRQVSFAERITVSTLLIGAFVTGFSLTAKTPANTVLPDILIRAQVPERIKFTATPKTYTADELYCLAAAIYNEAGGDYASDDTRLIVGQVILNRVADPRFPNTIREVLEAPRQYGRFSETGVAFPERSKNPGEKHAVERAWKLAEQLLSSNEPYCPTDIIWQAEFPQGKEIFRIQDGHFFCR